MYCLGQPETVIGPNVKKFEWKNKQLLFPNNEGILSPVEGDFEFMILNLHCFTQFIYVSTSRLDITKNSLAKKKSS